METMASRLLMVQLIISRSALLMVNGQDTAFYVNVALGKPARQSSTYIGDASWGDKDGFRYNASLAVDGKVETNFRNNSCSNTDVGQSSAWWEVDLENLYYITTITIYQRSDDPTNRNVGSTLSGKLQNDSYEVLTTLDRGGVFIFNTTSSNIFKGIRVDHSGTNDIYICLCEVQVFAVNIALRKPTNQSSTYIGDAKWGDTNKFIYKASLAVDGNLETNFRNNSCSSTAAGYNSAWWEVDLINLYYITAIKIYQRSDAFTACNAGSVVSGKLQDDSYENLTTLNRSGVIIFNTKSSHMFKGINVKHSGTTDMYICLCEVQVFVAITCNLAKLNRTMGTYKCTELVPGICAHNSILTIQCNPGYRLSGYNSSRCIGTDHWSSSIGVCNEITCNMPKLNQTIGTYTCTKLLGGACAYHSMLTIQCNTGYRLSGSNSIQCIDTDRWSGSIGVCNEITCSMPKLNQTIGTYTCTKLLGGACTYHSMLMIQCNMGYRLSGSKSVQCIDTDRWSRTIGVCEVVRCMDTIGERHNGSLEYQSGIEGNLTYNSTVSIRCQEGYNLTGTDHVRCVAHNVWDRTLGICSVVRCYDKILQRNNGFLGYDLGIEGNLTYNSTVSIRCRMGYNLIGTDHVRCNAHSHWDGTLGNCSVVRCVDESLHRNNSVLVYQSGIEGNLTYNATVSIGCQVGYTLTGLDLVRCNAHSLWNGTLGHCSVVRCVVESLQRNNSVLAYQSGIEGNLTYNATVYMGCKVGYTLTGIDLVRCNAHSLWNGTLGHCSVTRCTEIVPPEYGVIVVEPGTEGRWSFNTTVAIICNTGYGLNGETLIKCLETGRWTNALGYCLALQEQNAYEEESKTCLLGWVITGPLCLILLVTNIATCLRFRRNQSFKRGKRNNTPDDVTTANKVNASNLRLQAKDRNPAFDFVEDSDMETLKNKANQSENSAMEPYDNLQMENGEKSEYDQLTFEREASLNTTTKTEI